MYAPLTGPSKQIKLTVTDTVPVELRKEASAYEDRSVITLQADGKFYIYFADDGETPNAATVSGNGFWQGKNAKESYEASATQRVFVLGFSSTVDIVMAERA